MRARQWHRLHPPEKDEDEFDFIGAADVEIKLFLDEEGRTRNDIYQLILERVDKNELADMEVIFYLARDNCFSEYYEQRVAKAKIQYGFGFDNNLISLSHIIKKRNFLEEFGNGVAMLGRPSLAKQLSDLQPTLDAGET